MFTKNVKAEALFNIDKNYEIRYSAFSHKFKLLRYSSLIKEKSLFTLEKKSDFMVLKIFEKQLSCCLHIYMCLKRKFLYRNLWTCFIIRVFILTVLNLNVLHCGKVKLQLKVLSAQSD